MHVPLRDTHGQTEGLLIVVRERWRWDTIEDYTPRHTKLVKKELWLEEELETPEVIDHKALERKQGYLVHIIQAYLTLNPYLQGVHGKLDS